MVQQYLGEIAALLTAACWTVTAMAFESAGKRVGALSLNLIRLVIGLIFLAFYNAIFNDGFLPKATEYQWFWLALSGVVGFVLGDLFLFRAFILIGARISMLIMALVPPIAALIGWITLGEVLSGMEFLGMGITILGIVLVLSTKLDFKKGSLGKTLKAGPLVLGSLLALGGAVGQAAGLVLSKKGMQDMNAFEATQIRIMAGVVGFTLVITLFKRWGHLLGALKDLKAMKFMTLGSFTGPFLGVSFSLLAVQHTDTGVAATLMALTPVMIIPPAILLNKERIKIIEIIGAIVSIGGVILFFL
ncbi:MAG: EamA family transporter [Bacteroidetes bacterium]|nr:MAG: EamA family transporter [Bacteroidota bacterium]RLD92781.1 MAG: EamA family transporter [Bacteroidota bacterium]